MREALAHARVASENGEVPVGAVVVKNGTVIGCGASSQIGTNDPSAHAEVIALRNAAEHESNYRLVETTLYVTLEPCMMCAGLLVHARVRRLVFGCVAPKTGVIESQGALLKWPSHNHVVCVTAGVLAEECGSLLSAFFKQRREGV